MESNLTDKVGLLEETTNQLFREVFERIDALKEAELPKYEHPVGRPPIGITPSK